MNTTSHSDLPPIRGAQLALLSIAIALSSFIEMLDMTIVNVSIPAIAGSLGVSPTEGTWAISSYTLAAAIVQPLTGWISRRYGEVRTFLWSIMSFMICSAICGLATTMPMLVCARILQGLVSGPMVSVAQALLLQNFPTAKRGIAMGIWAMVVVLAPICGPVLGGWITENYSWPWLFYINIPVGTLSMLICWSLLKDRESTIVKTPIDGVGMGLLVVGVGCLQFVLDNGNDKDWFSSTEILVASVIAVVALTYLIVWELGDAHPALDLSLFKNRNYRVGVITYSVGYLAFFGSGILFPLWLQTTLGYTSLWAGYALAPIGILAMVSAPLLGRNLHRLNLRLVPSLGFLVLALSMFWQAKFTDQNTFWQFAAPRVVAGLGMALFFIPTNTLMMSSIKPHELANAAGLSNFLRSMAASVSSAVSILMWDHRTDYHQAVLTEHLHNDSAGWQQIQQSLTAQGLPDATQMAYVSRVVTEQASTMAINDFYLITGVVFLCLVPIIWFAKPPFATNPNATGH